MSAFDANKLLAILADALLKEPRGLGRAGALPVAWASTRGAVRKDNQDRIAVARAASGLTVAVLADGMGGMKDGGRAAAIAAGAVMARCLSSASTSIAPLLTDAMHFANSQVFRVLGGGGGAAVVAAAWLNDAGYIVHAGDARAYGIEANGSVGQLTVDDTVSAQLQSMGRAVSPGARQDGPLLQFVGVGEGLEPHVTEIPEGRRALILASDGVYGIGAPILSWLATRVNHLQDLPERLITASEWNGGADNGTAIVIGFPSAPALLDGSTHIWLPGSQMIMFAEPVRVEASAARPEQKTEKKSVVAQAHAKAAGKKRGRRDSPRSTSRKSKPRAPDAAGEPVERRLPISVSFESVDAAADKPSTTRGAEPEPHASQKRIAEES